jgi:hypothetical protein
METKQTTTTAYTCETNDKKTTANVWRSLACLETIRMDALAREEGWTQKRTNEQLALKQSTMRRVFVSSKRYGGISMFAYSFLISVLLHQSKSSVRLSSLVFSS